MKLYSNPNFEIESNFSTKIVAGVDEAGRGPLAGPVVAAAVILDANHMPGDINDSKKLSVKKREKLFLELVEYANCSIGICTPDEIDQNNILEATKIAMQRAVSNLNIVPNILLIDGNMVPDINIEKYAIIKGDTKSLSIAAASIIAKVARDEMMLSLAEKYPVYNWHRNSGYPTKQHVDAIKKYGITNLHRKSFSPCKV